MAFQPALATAEALLFAVQDDPDRVANEAFAILALPSSEDEAGVVTRYALGRAQHELGDIAAACVTLGEAAQEAERLGLSHRVGHIRGSLALSLATHGEIDRAFAELDAAKALLTGPSEARLGTQRAILLVHQGELDSALAAFDQAFDPLDRAGDDLAVARLLVSRGVARSLLGDDHGAEADYRAGADRASRLGQVALLASAQGNIAFSHGRRGDVPGALAWFQLARQSYGRSNNPGRYLAILESDLCDVLLQGGLYGEAVDAARRAVDLAREGENLVQEAEALLLLARALLGDRRPTQATAEAEEAARLFARTGREPWAAQAAYVATLASDGSAAEQLASLQALRQRLDATGWQAEALEVRLLIGQAFLDTDDQAAAMVELEAASVDRHRGPAVRRARAWQAAALARRANGDRGGALRAVKAGLQVIDQHRASLGATELRLHAAVHRRSLAELGLELAVESGRFANVLAWAQRASQGALAVPGEPPPDDDHLAMLMADYRRLTAGARAATAEGDAPTSDEHQLNQIERQIRDRWRLRPGRSDANLDRVEVADVRDRLGDRTMVQFFEAGGELGALVIGARRSRRVRIGRVDDFRSRLDHMSFCLRRLASQFGSEAGIERAAAAAVADARWLDDTVLSPLAKDSTGELVIVASEVLAEVAWNVCERARDQPISVVPSLHLWCRGTALPTQPRLAAFAAPELPHAVDEVAAIRRDWPHTTTEPSATATVGGALSAFERADIVHVAAHGTFRRDSPLFSSLALADGDLTWFDIEGVERTPHTVTLAACSAARSQVRVPGEVLGAAHVLHRGGTHVVVAPVLAVGDAATATTMSGFYRSLSTERRAAPALAAQLQPLRAERDATAWTARLFQVSATDDLA